MINKQLPDQIEQEAEANTIRFKDVNDYDAGRIGGYKEGYEAAGVHYGALWQAAEERAERAEKALREIKEKARYPKTENESGVALYNILKLCENALTPKTSEDGR